jgi:tetratricopeptide (TPR) repeat protein
MKRCKSVFGVAVVMTALAWAATAAAASHHRGDYDPQALNADPRRATGPIAPVLSGLGHNHHPVSTRSKQAQYFFDQGLRLTYAFNHQEALRSFKEAARLDPDCAMAYWGWALVLGPNLNLHMSPDVAPQAYAAVQMALARRNKATQRERAYIDALAKRYVADPRADRKPLDAAYAEAMRKVHERYPDDPDAATLYAAALMNLSPWHYWTPDGRPRAHTPEILRTLEEVMRHDPLHIGALHYYIHAVEAAHPDRGIAAADQLRDLAPAAGHLVHMPTHIYMQIGRYAESYTLNELAAKADEAYIARCHPQGIYPLGYYPHNLHFMTWAALMMGNSTKALTAARKLASQVPADAFHHSGGRYQTFASMPLVVMVRFGRWEDVLNEPAPPESWQYVAGIWHYARGMAYMRTDRFETAAQELGILKGIIQKAKSDGHMSVSGNEPTLLAIAAEVLAGELDAGQKRFDSAVCHVERAVRLQDGLEYDEPPAWYYPVRQTLGAILMEAGYPAEAEVVYWQDLRQYRDNGYSLFGLWQSLEAQGRDDEAVRTKKRFDRAWADADVTLSSSRF